jgi:hypothetical protein
LGERVAAGSLGSEMSVVPLHILLQTRPSVKCGAEPPNPAASFLLWATGRAQGAGKPRGSWQPARPWQPETSKRGARGYDDALAGHRSLAGSRAGRTAAGTVECGSGDACAGSELGGRGDCPAGRAWATRASRARAAIRPARRSAAALTRSTSCRACVTSQPARVKSVKRSRFGRAGQGLQRAEDVVVSYESGFAQDGQDFGVMPPPADSAWG